MGETSADIKEFVKGLMDKKEATEKEIKEYLDVLESQAGVGMDGALVDAEQFPRTDINLYTVRHARNRVICLRNDLKDLMKMIEENLETYFHLAKAETRGPDEDREGEGDMQVDDTHFTLNTFAKVDQVTPQSPAHHAGIRAGDELTMFGSINATNFIDMHTIAGLVQNSVGKPVSVTVVREGRPLSVTLTPHSWSGRGLLGCNIVPINRPDR